MNSPTVLPASGRAQNASLRLESSRPCCCSAAGLRSVTAAASLFVALAASAAAAQTASQVCARIPYADTRVACVRAIAGHQVANEAASVCGTIPFSDQVVVCLQGAVDKRFASGALEPCRSIPFAEEKAACVAAAGRRNDTRRRALEVEPDAEDFEDESFESAAQSIPDSTITFENRTSGVVIRRYYWRAPGGRWTEFGGRRALRGNSQRSIESHSGLYDFCVETVDGRSVQWERIRLEGNEQRLFFRARDVSDFECSQR
jgi:hypothetical protein